MGGEGRGGEGGNLSVIWGECTHRTDVCERLLNHPRQQQQAQTSVSHKATLIRAASQHSRVKDGKTSRLLPLLPLLPHFVPFNFHHYLQIQTLSFVTAVGGRRDCRRQL